MYKRIVSILLLVCVFMGGCSIKSSMETTAPNLFREIPLGITPEQLFEQLAEANLSVQMPDYEEFPLPEDVPDGVQDGRIYNMTDLSFYYKAEGLELYFTFSYEGELVTVSCSDGEISMPMGLAVGDSLDAAKSIYGSNYEENCEDYSVLQYRTDEGYLAVFYEENAVTSWRLSKYPNINND